jgi:hypothetical protein
MTNDILDSTLLSMYNAYGFSNKVGIQYFTDFLPALQQFRIEKIIKHQMRYPHQYVLDFILSCPTLWEKLDSSMWVTILTQPGIRRDPSKINDQLAYFIDIEFLNRYVGVDAFSFATRSKEISNIEKDYIFSYFAKFSFALPSDRFDAEDLDGVYFVKQEVLKDLRTRLIRDHGFAPFNTREENIEEYIENIRKHMR